MINCIDTDPMLTFISEITAKDFVRYPHAFKVFIGDMEFKFEVLGFSDLVKVNLITIAIF